MGEKEKKITQRECYEKYFQCDDYDCRYYDYCSSYCKDPSKLPKEVKKMPKKIEISYDLDYGIFTIKTTGLGLSKTKLNQLESQIKRKINEFLEV